MSSKQEHPYHLVDESPWPLVASGIALGLALGLVKLFYFNNWSLLILRLLGIVLLIGQWWRDVSREASVMGLHSQIVELGLRWGIALFIISEIFFFLCFIIVRIVSWCRARKIIALFKIVKRDFFIRIFQRRAWRNVTKKYVTKNIVTQRMEMLLNTMLHKL